MRTWWPLGWACTLNDIFVRFPYEKCKSLVAKTKNLKRLKVKQVFRECINQILTDITVNNDTFISPKMKYYKGELHMEPITGNEFIDLRKKGKFSLIDFLESNFTGYLMYLYLKGKRDNFLSRRKFPVYVNKFFKDNISKRVNAGKSYG